MEEFKTYLCNCALPALTGSTKCCENCLNNPNRKSDYKIVQVTDSTINLQPEDAQKLSDTLNNPPEPTEDLKKLFEYKIKVSLKDYKDEVKTFDVDLSKKSMHNLTIVYTVQSGDEVVYIFEDNKKIYTLDSSDNRTTDFLDEIKLISIEELALLNKKVKNNEKMSCM